MAQEEYTRCSSGGSGGGCRPKKTKQKKAPQRGLGVAQLEKIISEEKQKKGCFGNNSDSDTPFLALRPTNFRPNIENYISEGGFIKSWNNNNNIGSMSHNLNIAFEPQLNLAYDQSNGPVLAQRLHLFQSTSSCSSPLVKYSSGISTVMSTQMEPPSIPSVHFKNYAFTEEDKMSGMMKKRPYPFSQDHSHPIISSSKSDEFASSFTNHIQQQHTLHISQPRNKLIRESVSNSGVPIDSERLNGKFLTLAPPLVESPPLKPVHKHALDYLGRTRLELSDNQSIPGQIYSNKSEIERAGPGFSFFPVEEMRSNRDSVYVISGGNGENGETIDLNLKL